MPNSTFKEEILKALKQYSGFDIPEEAFDEEIKNPEFKKDVLKALKNDAGFDIPEEDFNKELGIGVDNIQSETLNRNLQEAITPPAKEYKTEEDKGTVELGTGQSIEETLGVGGKNIVQDKLVGGGFTQDAIADSKQMKANKLVNLIDKGKGQTIEDVKEIKKLNKELLGKDLGNISKSNPIYQSVKGTQEQDKKIEAKQKESFVGESIRSMKESEKKLKQMDVLSYEYGKQIANSAIKGAAQIVPDMVAFTGAISDDIVRESIFETSNEISKELSEWFPTEQAFDKSMAGMVSNAGGQMLSTIATGGVMSGVAKKVGQKLGTKISNKLVLKAVESGTQSSLLGLQVYGSSFKEAIESGASESDAHISALIKSVSAIGTEGVSTQRLVNRLTNGSKTVRNKFYDVLSSSAENGLGEGLDQLIGNATDKFILDKEKDILDGVADAVLVGSITAGGISTAGSIVNTLRDRSKKAEENGDVENAEKLKNMADNVEKKQSEVDQKVTAIQESITPEMADDLGKMKEYFTNYPITEGGVDIEQKVLSEMAAEIRVNEPNLTNEEISNRIVGDKNLNQQFITRVDEARGVTQEQAPQDTAIQNEAVSQTRAYLGEKDPAFTEVDANGQFIITDEELKEYIVKNPNIGEVYENILNGLSNVPTNNGNTVPSNQIEQQGVSEQVYPVEGEQGNIDPMQQAEPNVNVANGQIEPTNTEQVIGNENTQQLNVPPINQTQNENQEGVSTEQNVSESVQERGGETQSSGNEKDTSKSKDNRNKKIVLNEDKTFNATESHSRLSTKFGNDFDFTKMTPDKAKEIARQLHSTDVSQVPTKQEFDDLLDLIEESERLVKDTGYQQDKFVTKEQAKEQISKLPINERAKKILSVMVDGLKSDQVPNVEWNTNKNAFSQSGARVSLKSAGAFIHEIGHFGYFNILSGKERLTIMRKFGEKFYDQNGNLKKGTRPNTTKSILNNLLPTAWGKQSFKVDEKFQEYFAEQFALYQNGKLVDSDLESIFDKLWEYIKNALQTFKEKGLLDADLVKHFDKIIDPKFANKLKEKTVVKDNLTTEKKESPKEEKPITKVEPKEITVEKVEAKEDKKKEEKTVPNVSEMSDDEVISFIENTKQRQQGNDIHYRIGNEDMGIVAGWNNLFGNQVYVGYKGSNRTRIDISRYDGDLFSINEKNNLLNFVEILKKYEKLKSKTTIFDIQGNVAATDSIPVSYKNLLTHLVKTLGLKDIKIVITTDADLTKEQVEKYKFYGKFASLRVNLLDNVAGYMQKIEPNTYRIHLTNLSGKASFSTLNHEFGHIVESVLYSKLDAKTKKEIEEEYLIWKANLEGKKIVDVARELRDVFAHESFMENNGNNTDVYNLSNSHHKYLASFSEYLADNVAKWIRSSEKPKNAVEQFFKDLADEFKKVYDYVFKTGHYSKSIFKWLDEQYKYDNDNLLSYPIIKDFIKDVKNDIVDSEKQESKTYVKPKENKEESEEKLTQKINELLSRSKDDLGDKKKLWMLSGYDLQIAEENVLKDKQQKEIDEAKKDIFEIENNNPEIINKYVKKSGYKLIDKNLSNVDPYLIQSETIRKRFEGKEGLYYKWTGALHTSTAFDLALTMARKKASSRPKGKPYDNGYKFSKSHTEIVQKALDSGLFHNAIKEGRIDRKAVNYILNTANIKEDILDKEINDELFLSENENWEDEEDIEQAKKLLSDYLQDISLDFPIDQTLDNKAQKEESKKQLQKAKDKVTDIIRTLKEQGIISSIVEKELLKRVNSALFIEVFDKKGKASNTGLRRILNDTLEYVKTYESELKRDIGDLSKVQKDLDELEYGFITETDKRQAKEKLQAKIDKLKAKIEDSENSLKEAIFNKSIIDFDKDIIFDLRKKLKGVLASSDKNMPINIKTFAKNLLEVNLKNASVEDRNEWKKLALVLYHVGGKEGYNAIILSDKNVKSDEEQGLLIEANENAIKEIESVLAKLESDIKSSVDNVNKNREAIILKYREEKARLEKERIDFLEKAISNIYGLEVKGINAKIDKLKKDKEEATDEKAIEKIDNEINALLEQINVPFEINDFIKRFKDSKNPDLKDFEQQIVNVSKSLESNTESLEIAKNELKDVQEKSKTSKEGVSKLQKELDEKRDKIKKLQKEKEAIRVKLTEYNNTISDKKALLKNEKDSKNRAILNVSISNLEKNVNELQATIQKTEKSIEDLQSELESVQKVLNESKLEDSVVDSELGKARFKKEAIEKLVKKDQAKLQRLKTFKEKINNFTSAVTEKDTEKYTKTLEDIGKLKKQYKSDLSTNRELLKNARTQKANVTVTNSKGETKEVEKSVYEITKDLRLRKSKVELLPKDYKKNYDALTLEEDINTFINQRVKKNLINEVLKMSDPMLTFNEMFPREQDSEGKDLPRSIETLREQKDEYKKYQDEYNAKQDIITDAFYNLGDENTDIVNLLNISEIDYDFLTKDLPADEKAEVVRLINKYKEAKEIQLTERATKKEQRKKERETKKELVRNELLNRIPEKIKQFIERKKNNNIEEYKRNSLLYDQIELLSDNEYLSNISVERLVLLDRLLENALVFDKVNLLGSYIADYKAKEYIQNTKEKTGDYVKRESSVFFQNASKKFRSIVQKISKMVGADPDKIAPILAGTRMDKFVRISNEADNKWEQMSTGAAGFIGKYKKTLVDPKNPKSISLEKHIFNKLKEIDTLQNEQESGKITEKEYDKKVEALINKETNSDVRVSMRNKVEFDKISQSFVGTSAYDHFTRNTFFSRRVDKAYSLSSSGSWRSRVLGIMLILQDKLYSGESANRDKEIKDNITRLEAEMDLEMADIIKKLDAFPPSKFSYFTDSLLKKDISNLVDIVTERAALEAIKKEIETKDSSYRDSLYKDDYSFNESILLEETLNVQRFFNEYETKHKNLVALFENKNLTYSKNYSHRTMRNLTEDGKPNSVNVASTVKRAKGMLNGSDKERIRLEGIVKAKEELVEAEKNNSADIEEKTQKLRRALGGRRQEVDLYSNIEDLFKDYHIDVESFMDKLVSEYYMASKEFTLALGGGNISVGRDNARNLIQHIELAKDVLFTGNKKQGLNASFKIMSMVKSKVSQLTMNKLKQFIFQYWQSRLEFYAKDFFNTEDINNVFPPQIYNKLLENPTVTRVFKKSGVAGREGVQVVQDLQHKKKDLNSAITREKSVLNETMDVLQITALNNQLEKVENFFDQAPSVPDFWAVKRWWIRRLAYEISVSEGNRTPSEIKKGIENINWDNILKKIDNGDVKMDLILSKLAVQSDKIAGTSHHAMKSISSQETDTWSLFVNFLNSYAQFKTINFMDNISIMLNPKRSERDRSEARQYIFADIVAQLTLGRFLGVVTTEIAFNVMVKGLTNMLVHELGLEEEETTDEEFYKWLREETSKRFSSAIAKGIYSGIKGVFDYVTILAGGGLNLPIAESVTDIASTMATNSLARSRKTSDELKELGIFLDKYKRYDYDPKTQSRFLMELMELTENIPAISRLLSITESTMISQSIMRDDSEYTTESLTGRTQSKLPSEMKYKAATMFGFILAGYLIKSGDLITAGQTGTGAIAKDKSDMFGGRAKLDKKDKNTGEDIGHLTSGKDKALRADLKEYDKLEEEQYQQYFGMSKENFEAATSEAFELLTPKSKKDNIKIKKVIEERKEKNKK